MVTSLAYVAPTTQDEVLARLHNLGPDAKVLAGGQDLMPLLNQGRLRAACLVDLKALTQLATVRMEDGALVVGAMTTHHTIERLRHPAAGPRLVAEAAGQIGGGLQVRNRGTIGGALCAANPAYDYLSPLVAIEAHLTVARVAGRRHLAIGDLFQSATALRADELLTEIAIPDLGPDSGWAYEKLKFTDGGYGIANAACIVALHPDHSYRFVRLALGGVAAAPIRLRTVEAMLTGSRLIDTVLNDVAAQAAALVDEPIADVMADGEYRRAMAGVVTRRALVRATERARGKAPQ